MNINNRQPTVYDLFSPSFYVGMFLHHKHQKKEKAKAKLNNKLKLTPNSLQELEPKPIKFFPCQDSFSSEKGSEIIKNWEQTKCPTCQKMVTSIDVSKSPYHVTPIALKQLSLTSETKHDQQIEYPGPAAIFNIRSMQTSWLQEKSESYDTEKESYKFSSIIKDSLIENFTIDFIKANNRASQIILSLQIKYESIKSLNAYKFKSKKLTDQIITSRKIDKVLRLLNFILMNNGFDKNSQTKVLELYQGVLKFHTMHSSSSNQSVLTDNQESSL